MTVPIEERPSLRRPSGYDKAARRAARLAAVGGEHETAASLASLLQDVAGLPRRDALDLLSIASRPLVELVGAGVVRVALDDVSQMWP